MSWTRASLHHTSVRGLATSIATMMMDQGDVPLVHTNSGYLDEETVGVDDKVVRMGENKRFDGVEVDDDGEATIVDIKRPSARASSVVGFPNDASLPWINHNTRVGEHLSDGKNHSGHIERLVSQDSIVDDGRGECRDLKELAARFLLMIRSYGLCHIVIEQAAAHLEVPEWHILEIISSLEGAGVMEKSVLDNDHTAYRWIAPGVDFSQDHFLDTTIESMEAMKRQQEQQYITPHYLTPLIQDKTRLLMINASHSSVTMLASAFSLAVSDHTLPTCVLVEGNDCSNRPIAFASTTVDSNQSLQSPNVQEMSPRKRDRASSLRQGISTRSSHHCKRQKISVDDEPTTPPTPAEKPHSLAVLATAFTQMVADSGSTTIDINEAVKQMNVSKRRLYDIINVLEGAQVLERIPGTARTARASYEWIAPGYFAQQDATNDEQDFLHFWMDRLRINPSSSSNESFVTPQDLLELAEQESTLLAISTLENTSSITQYHNPEHNRFSMSMTVPDSSCDESGFPQAYLFGNGVDMQPITFASHGSVSNKENHVFASTHSTNNSDDVRDYSPLKKLLAAISTEEVGGVSDTNGDSAEESSSSLVSSVYAEPPEVEKRHSFEAFLEASTSVLREQATNNE